MGALVQRSNQLEPAHSAPAQHHDIETALISLRTLKEITLQLICELQCIEEVRPISFEQGVDFYDEVTRFEIDLIKRALLLTSGHQGRAARLLNLRATTLNSKIKQYGICLHTLNGVPFPEQKDPVPHQHL